MSKRILLAAVLIFMTASISHAQISNIAGNMDATLASGQSTTFQIDVNVGSSGFNQELNMYIDAEEGLTLSAATVTPPIVQCTVTHRDGKDFETCLGGVVNIGANSAVQISQTVTASTTLGKRAAAEGIGSLLAHWHVQLIGTALSGFPVRTGTITFGIGRPYIVIVRYPDVVVQDPSASGVTTTMVLRNYGSAIGSWALGNFSSNPPFTDDSSSVLHSLLPNGDSATITFRSLNKPAGEYAETFLVSGLGGGDQLVRMRLDVASRPSSNPAPEPSASRFDVSFGSPPAPRTVTIGISNTGTGSVEGAFDGDVFLAVPNGVIEINPGETKNFDVTVDPAQIPHSGDSGSVNGTARLVYLKSASGKGLQPLDATTGTGSISISFVSTTPPPITNSAPPSLAAKCPTCFTDTAVFIPGVGHVVGSVGLFISDLTVFPKVGFGGPGTSENRTLSNVDLYFTPLNSPTSAAKKISVGGISPPSSVAFGDMVSTVFASNQVGTLQVRTLNFTIDEILGLNANVFNVSNKAGTYGTSLPVFISDYAVRGSDKEYLTGLRKDATSHTNLYLQEAVGSDVTAGIDFYDVAGNKIGSTTASVPAFGATQLGGSTVPNGTVSAAVGVAGGNGALHAYATPVDEASGDTWVVVDWSRVYSYHDSSLFTNGANVLIPVAGAAHGANNTYFKTDASIMNVGSTPASGTLRYYLRGGGTVEKTLNLNPLQTQVFGDITTNFLGVTTDSVGYMTYIPTAGRVAITSRNYTTSPGSAATFGTAVPTLPIRTTFGSGGSFLGSGISSGGTVRIAGIEDSALTTVGAAQPGSFRSNLGLVEVSGQPATVQVTVYFNTNTDKTSVTQGASKSYDLTPNQFALIGNIANDVLGASRASLGDLHNMTVEFKVTGGAGRVVPFISSVDNGSGDSTFRVN